MDVSIPENILKGLEETFKADSDSHARALFFLSDSLAKGTGEPYINALQDVVNNIQVFQKVAERLAQDTKTAEKDPQYKQMMYEIWNSFMKDGLTEHDDDLSLVLVWSEAEVAQACFMRAVSRLSPASYTALSNTVQAMGGRVAMYGGRALSYARQAQPVVKVALVTVCLAWDVIKNIRRWWNGEITGKRCVKNIVDCGVGVAGGLAGGIGGEMAGAAVGAFAGPIGFAVGAVGGAIVGGIIGSIASETLCNRLTQWIFGLPKSEALEKAYNFLGVSASDSNSEINTEYRQLALKYHPDKGGDKDKWTQLQYSMAIIRQARGES